MRAVFGLLSLLVALAAVALVAVLAKKQLKTSPAISPPILTPQQQSNLAQQQYKKALESVLQQPRLLPKEQKND